MGLCAPAAPHPSSFPPLPLPVRFVLLLILIREGIAAEVPPGFRFFCCCIIIIPLFPRRRHPSIHPSIPLLFVWRQPCFFSPVHQCGEFGFALHTESHGAKCLPLGSAGYKPPLPLLISFVSLAEAKWSAGTKETKKRIHSHCAVTSKKKMFFCYASC